MLYIIKRTFYDLRHVLHVTPMHKVRRELHKRGIDMGKLTALDMFGGRGDMVTRDFGGYVGRLEIWEINPEYERILRRRFPRATIRITDTCEAIKQTRSKFSLCVADTWMSSTWGGHWEHFDLFPDVFRVLAAPAILVLNVLPEVHRSKLSQEHFRRRQLFYGVQDPTHIPLDYMVNVYDKMAREHGKTVQWWFYKDRYFLFSMRKSWLKKRLGFLVLGLDNTCESDLPGP